MLKKMAMFLSAGMFILGLAGLSFAMTCEIKKGGRNECPLKTRMETEGTKKIIYVGNDICPVGEEKIGEKGVVSCEYLGRVYNLCSEKCAEEFRKSPRKFIQKIRKAMRQEAKRKAEEKKAAPPANESKGGSQ